VYSRGGYQLCIKKEMCERKKFSPKENEQDKSITFISLLMHSIIQTLEVKIYIV